MAIMIEGEDGEYYLQAGAILVPGMYCPTDEPIFLLRPMCIDGRLLVGVRRNVAAGR